MSITTPASSAVTARIAERLASSVGRHRYNMWFERSARMAYTDEDHQLQVTVPTKVVADWIEAKFRDALLRCAMDEVGSPVDLSVCVDAAAFPTENEGDSRQRSGAATAAAAHSPGDHASPRTYRASHQRWRGHRDENARTIRYQLDDFVVGPSNELAFNAAHQLVDQEQPTVSPLFIHGGVGLGKTHLLQGACAAFRARNPDARILYTTGEKFTNEFLAAIANRSLDVFRKRIRRLDFLAIDDVHFLAGKEKSQQEFLHSFDEIDLSGARVVMASDNHPKLIRLFSAALVSRCVAGLVVEVKQPDTATRIRIVKALAQRRGLSLMESVIAVLASRCTGSVREVEGLLAKLHALAGMGNAPKADATPTGAGPQVIGHGLVNRMFQAQDQAPRRRVSFDRIMEVVAEQLHVTRAQILSSQRVKHLVLARSLVIFLTRQMTTMSYPEISYAIHKNSHSTIIAADRRIAEQLNSNAALSTGGAGSTDETGGGIEMIPLSDLVDRLKQAILRA
ncbi:MAG: DnaA/Hda family protein [Phycisphaeraceae bacterium]